MLDVQPQELAIVEETGLQAKLDFWFEFKYGEKEAILHGLVIKVMPVVTIIWCDLLILQFSVEIV